jgi:hypothetical protein
MVERMLRIDTAEVARHVTGGRTARRVGQVLALLLVLLSGCQSAAGPTRLIDRVEDPRLTERELRVGVYEYLRHWTVVVELAADDILSRSGEAGVRRNAILWKLDAVSACQVAVFREDPVGALLDVWALSAQMTRYLETGAGKDLFGAWQPIAIEAARQLEVDVEALAGRLADPSRGRELVTKWAEEHPIHGSLTNRPTTVSILAAYTGKPRRLLFRGLPDIDQRIADLLERLDLYVETLPHQVRWHMEYVLEQRVLTRQKQQDGVASLATMGNSLEEMSDSLERMADSLGRMADSLDRVATLPDELGDLVASEREQIFAAIDQQREAIFRNIAAEREAVLDALQDERGILVEATDGQRAALLAEAEAVAVKAIEQAAGESRQIIDRLLWGVTLCGVTLVAVLFVAGLVFVRLAGRTARRRDGTG